LRFYGSVSDERIACYTGDLRYQGQAIRIDGGAAMHSLTSTVPTLHGGAFGQALGMSMAFTYYNPLRFRRFAEQVLGERYEQDRAQLRHDFKQVLDRLLGTAYNDWHRGLYPTEEGFGRTDAFGRIANRVPGRAGSFGCAAVWRAIRPARSRRPTDRRAGTGGYKAPVLSCRAEPC
jgi:hypothetical protein